LALRASSVGSYLNREQLFEKRLGNNKVLKRVLLDDNMTYTVRQDVTTIVDVSDAINFVRDVRDRAIADRECLLRFGLNDGVDYAD
jgi:hypothetical protein